MVNKIIDNVWDDTPVDVTAEANFIWSIANKLRGSYMPDKYGDVIIPMTIIRRFECALAATKDKVIAKYEENPNHPPKALCHISKYHFYNTSGYDLAELCNESESIAENFKSYVRSFSANVQDILNELEIEKHIDKMDKDGCLYTVVKAFSELDLSLQTFDSIRMGYIFENLIGRFYQNVDAGQFYKGRDIIKLLVEILMAEGCDDIFDDGKVITVCDQACGTGGMLSTAYNYIKHFNPTADVRLFGQEFMGQSYAVGLAEMLIKNQDAENFRHVDTFKEDCFSNQKMRFVIENPPFGTPWSGKDAKEGQEIAVREEYKKGENGRWGHGLPSGGDSQMIFLQSAIDKMDDNFGRAAIIENGSPLFNGDTASGESQIRRWLLEKDLIEAIIALPTDLFYNTGIQTYVWILSKNKRTERKGKIQLINAAEIYHKLRKALGNKKNEISTDDRKAIVHLYADFVPTENCKIYDNTEFLYREYAVMQPLQRSYAITEERIEQMLVKGTLSTLYDEAKIAEYENLGVSIEDKDKRKYEAMLNNKPIFDSILETLKANVSDKVYKEPKSFISLLSSLLTLDKKLIDKIADGLSEMDKTAEIQRDKKGNVIYDKETYDKEIVKHTENIEDYMVREVLPYVPDAQWFWEENLGAKKPVIKIGAEIPFTRYFYKYQQPQPSEQLAAKFMELETSVSQRIKNLFGEK
ncbi:MAG: type I restriction-modification system subunit M [Ruminococcus sp.]|nr:type I restriction-modification system subunit M [Ruminococcus sp.]